MECPACQQPNVDGSRFCAKCGVLLPVANTDDDPLINTVVGGRYRITGVLGEGGMGRVYTGEQQMGTKVRKVAVKTLLAEYARQPETVARFMRECGTVSELEHPNTIRVYDFGQTPNGDLYIAMELLTGRSLEDELVKVNALPPERVDRIIGQVCGSLQEAHDKGIIHRDLKPANIMLSTRAGEEDYVKVLDFGIAKRSEGSEAGEQKLTQQGKILGTPPYMSPEQFVGKELDARSDIYSLGVMTYEMLVGRLPFEADTPWAWATQHMTAQPFPFETVPIGAHVPQKMKAAVMRALQKDRQNRQQSAREFFDDLTIGAQRMSVIAPQRASSGSFADAPPTPGTAMMPQPPSGGAPHPGQTQVGEPFFPPQGQVAGRTVVDASSGVYAPSAGSVPTGGGQAFPAPPPPAKRSGMNPLVIVLGGLIAAGGAVGLAFALKGGKKDAGSGDPIAVPTVAPQATVASDPVATTEPSSAATGKPTAAGHPGTNPTAKPTATAAVDEHERECEAAMDLAHGNNVVMAVNHFRNCDGPKRATALSAINTAAQNLAAQRGCGAMPEARAASAIGASSALTELRDRKHCR